MTRLRSNSDNSGPDGESEPNSVGDAPILSGSEIGGSSPVPLNNRSLDAEIALGSAIIQTVWAWIEGVRMRLKIRRDLGREATQTDLASISTWMKVDEVEHRKDLDKSANIDRGTHDS